MGEKNQKNSTWDNLWQKTKDAFAMPPPPRELTEEEKKANLERRSPDKTKAREFQKGFGYEK